MCQLVAKFTCSPTLLLSIYLCDACALELVCRLAVSVASAAVGCDGKTWRDADFDCYRAGRRNRKAHHSCHVAACCSGDCQHWLILHMVFFVILFGTAMSLSTSCIRILPPFIFVFYTVFNHSYDIATIQPFAENHYTL